MKTVSHLEAVELLRSLGLPYPKSSPPPFPSFSRFNNFSIPLQTDNEYPRVRYWLTHSDQLCVSVIQIQLKPLPRNAYLLNHTAIEYLQEKGLLDAQKFYFNLDRIEFN